MILLTLFYRVRVPRYSKSVAPPLRDWEITQQKGFPSGNEGIRDLVLVRDL